MKVEAVDVAVAVGAMEGEEGLTGKALRSGRKVDFVCQSRSPGHQGVVDLVEQEERIADA